MIRQFLRPLRKMSTSPIPKRLKTSSDTPVLIGTHSGHFHADEALAVYMLRQLPHYHNASLLRTRDPAQLATCHTVVDVGGLYDPSTHRYDHHQRGFAETFPGFHTKLSSAGLVWMNFGRQIVAQALKTEPEEGNVDVVWNKVYESFIEALDAHDNGIAVYDPKAIEAAGLQKRFSESGFGLGAMVGRLNGNWNDELPEALDERQKIEDGRFEVASRRVGEEFDREVEYLVKAWLPAREIVKEAFAKRQGGGRLLVLEGGGVPWKDHLFALEEEAGETGKVVYVLYPESATEGAKWRIQAVPVATDSFESRKSLPEAWRGMRDEKLSEISGVDGGVFVHAAGFIGGNKTFQGVSEMALKALEM